MGFDFISGVPSFSFSVILIQNYREITDKLTTGPLEYWGLIILPNIILFVAHQAHWRSARLLVKVLKEVTIEAQAEAGYHRMLSLKRTIALVNYTELLAKVAGTAINTATTELC